MQYCSLLRQLLLPSPVTSTTVCSFCFGSASLFLLELFLHSSPVAYWALYEQYEMAMEDALPRSVGTQYATGEEWRNNSRNNEEAEPKQKQSPAVDGTGDGSKFQCCKEQYCVGTWNARSMNQGKLEVVDKRWQE